jgi:predicted nuclease with TOPRIM domain
MAQFSCEQLREKRERANAVIASDQSEKRQLDAALRRNEVETANLRAELQRLKAEPSLPSIPSGRRSSYAGQRRRQRDRDAASEGAGAIPQLFPNFRRIKDLEDQIDALEQARQRLLPQYARTLRRMNEMLDGRGCIIEAMRRKGCIGY